MSTYWTIVELYSITIVSLTYVFKFYGLSEILKNFHISNDLQIFIGLDEYGHRNFEIFWLPAMMSIVILVYFQYFHRRMIKSLGIERSIFSFENNNIQVNPQTESTQDSRIWTTIILFIHEYLDKCIYIFMVLLILFKPCLLNGILLVFMLLWTLFDYNKFITKILFLYITSYIIIVFGYQLPQFNHNRFQIEIFIEKDIMYNNSKSDTFILNFAELFGLRKYDSNEVLFVFLVAELLILLLMTIKKIISVSLKLKHISPDKQSFFFSNVKYADINNPIPDYYFHFFGNDFTLEYSKSGLETGNLHDFFGTGNLLTAFIFVYNPNVPWKTIYITKTLSITLFDDIKHRALLRPLMISDFLLIALACRQLEIFRKDSLQETILKATNEYPDYTTESSLDVLKRIVFNNVLWIIIFCIFYTGITNVDLFSLGYLCAGTLFFWKGTSYYLMPFTRMYKLWNYLMAYIILVVFFKILFHLFGCFILSYYEWNSCILMRFFSIYCPRSPVEKPLETCGRSLIDIRLYGDVYTLILALLQRLFYKSNQFLKLIEDTKATAQLATKMHNLVKTWERLKIVENRQIDLDSLSKIKLKLNNIRNSKEPLAKRKLKHFSACGDGEYMFAEIYDDTYLVQKYDEKRNFHYYEHMVHGSSFIYRQFVYFILLLTNRINRFSKEYRHIIHILHIEKQILLQKNTNLAQLNNHDENSIEHLHWMVQFLLAVWNALQASTMFICYISIFINAVDNSYDTISMVPVIAVLFWGQLSVPRPTKTFWMVLITYMQVTGVVKYICSFQEIPWVKEEIIKQNNTTSDYPEYPSIEVGIGYYQHKIPTDLFVLLALFLHREILMKLGLWTYNFEHKEWTMIQIPIKNKNSTLTLLRLITINIKIHFTPMIDFYNDLRKHHANGSSNVYPVMFILIFVQIPCNILNSRTAAESLTLNNRVSQLFLKTFIIYIGALVIDRWFYVRRYILGKFIFHLIFTIIFLQRIKFGSDKHESILNYVWAYSLYIYITISAYQIRNGYLNRNASSFFWSRYTIFNWMAYKLYYLCPFVHEIRTILDWMWSDSSLTLFEWFKVEELFAYMCCVKCLWNCSNSFDNERGKYESRKTKLLLGGGILIGILAIVIFPIAWFSMLSNIPDTPSSMDFSIAFEEVSRVIQFRTELVQKLDKTDFRMIKEEYELYNNDPSYEFLQQYKYDEVSSIISKSMNTRLSDTHYNKLKEIIDGTKHGSSKLKVSAEWSLTHRNDLMKSKGKHTVTIYQEDISQLSACIDMFEKSSSYKCKQFVIENLLPKFIVLNLKSSKVQSDLMLHNPSRPYMDVGMTFFQTNESSLVEHWCKMNEICPRNENTNYLKNIPFSSCADDMRDSIDGIIYNIYVFTYRFSNTWEILDDKGIVGLYTIIIVSIGYKLAFDIFRSFRFKLAFTEIPYPDRVLQLCYEIYLVRSFDEFEMEEDLYAMLIFLFRSPETFIRYTRLPANIQN